jgi:hypothetical protein
MLNLAVPQVLAITFDTSEVNDNHFIVVAAPYGSNPTNYQLLILEQISQERSCWRENNSTPTTVDPLLLNFDFTGICGRSIDGNSYSVRLDGQDLGMHYLLSIQKHQDELVLIATPSPTLKSQAPAIEIGRTNGITDGFLKINLDAGWRLTRRTYLGRPLGHLYLTGSSETVGISVPQLGNITVSAPAPRPLPADSSPRELIFTPPSTPSVSPLPPLQEEEPASTDIPVPIPPTLPSQERKIPTF